MEQDRAHSSPVVMESVEILSADTLTAIRAAAAAPNPQLTLSVTLLWW